LNGGSRDDIVRRAMTGLHEDIRRDGTAHLKPGSEKSFGLVFAGVAVVLGALPLLDGSAPVWWLFAVAAGFAAIAYIAPGLYRVPNYWWFRLGNLLASIVGPLAIAIVYATTVIPIGLLMRALGKDILRLRRDPAAPTYWIDRRPPGPAPETLRNQF
jgi:hypothetical protein